MKLDQYATMTRQVIASTGFQDYFPSIIFPARQTVTVGTLVDFPEDIEGPESFVLQWASHQVQNGEEFLVAFKVDADHFKIIRRIGPYSEEETYSVER